MGISGGGGEAACLCNLWIITTSAARIRINGTPGTSPPLTDYPLPSSSSDLLPDAAECCGAEIS